MVFDLRLYFRVWRAKRWQNRVLNRIRCRAIGAKINVLFFVSDIAKWKCQSVYEALADSDMFEPLVVIGLLPQELKAIHSVGDVEKVFASKESYFSNCDCRHRRVYTGFPLKLIKPDQFAADIVFLQQPWGLPKPYKPYLLSKTALPMFVPYSVSVAYDDKLDRMPFHRSLHTHFLLNDGFATLFKSKMRGSPSIARYVASGHPALDSISSALKTYAVKKPRVVIYAPHFSFPHPNNVLGVGTFLENGKLMLEFAKKHTELSWVFKPHPLLAETLVSKGGWKQSEVKAYYEEWKRIGRVVLDGSYQRLFAESSVMVTDCVSFLVEYGATGHPIIRPLSNSHRLDASMLANSPYVAKYYQTKGTAELLKMLELIVAQGADPMRESRMDAIRHAGLLGQCATERIIDYLKDIASQGSRI